MMASEPIRAGRKPLTQLQSDEEESAEMVELREMLSRPNGTAKAGKRKSDKQGNGFANRPAWDSRPLCADRIERGSLLFHFPSADAKQFGATRAIRV